MNRSRRTPSYRLHKPTSQAIVVLNGKMLYLGRYGSVESRQEYHRLITEWLAIAAVPSSPLTKAGDLTIAEMLVGYVRHCEGYYAKSGETTNQICVIRLALKVLNRLYGHTLVRDFGPLALKACRSEFITQGLSRKECNRRTNLLKQAFRWATENELAPPALFHALQAVKGLHKGRTEAHEPEPVHPVADEIVDATVKHLNPIVAAMVQIQRLTGMRSGELIKMRLADIDRSEANWEYRLATHKTAHHGKDRTVVIGPKAQEILKPWLNGDENAFIFSPRQSMAQILAGRRQNRRTPRWPSHQAIQARKRKKSPAKSPGDRYSVGSYRQAVTRACDAAFPHPVLGGIPKKDLNSEQHAELEAWRKRHRWHPHALRHSAATEIRRKYGVEAAQAVLGHSQIGATQIYAERNSNLARDVMRAIG